MPATLWSFFTRSRAAVGVSTSSAMISLFFDGIGLLCSSGKYFTQRRKERKGAKAFVILLCAFASLREKPLSSRFATHGLLEICETFASEDLGETFVDLLHDA